MNWEIKNYNDGSSEIVFTNVDESITGFLFSPDDWFKFKAEVSKTTDVEAQAFHRFQENDDEITLKFS